jgi:hypothetical protein
MSSSAGDSSWPNARDAEEELFADNKEMSEDELPLPATTRHKLTVQGRVDEFNEPDLDETGLFEPCVMATEASEVATPLQMSVEDQTSPPPSPPSPRQAAQLEDVSAAKEGTSEHVGNQRRRSSVQGIATALRRMSGTAAPAPDLQPAQAADMWSFGCLLAFVGTGHPPYAEDVHERAATLGSLQSSSNISSSDVYRYELVESAQRDGHSPLERLRRVGNCPEAFLHVAEQYAHAHPLCTSSERVLCILTKPLIATPPQVCPRRAHGTAERRQCSQSVAVRGPRGRQEIARLRTRFIQHEGEHHSRAEGDARQYAPNVAEHKGRSASGASSQRADSSGHQPAPRIHCFPCLASVWIVKETGRAQSVAYWVAFCLCSLQYEAVSVSVSVEEVPLLGARQSDASAMAVAPRVSCEKRRVSKRKRETASVSAWRLGPGSGILSTTALSLVFYRR